ncbi:MAG: cytochrome b5 domain-containing protein [Planctomycetota bacterium]|jgi:predicted heme/steroid binding protein
MRQFTTEELAEFDGAAGRAAYVAYEGTVYDVTESFLWKAGRHQGLHFAGRDLSGRLDNAPHGPEFLLRFPVVGRLAQ